MSARKIQRTEFATLRLAGPIAANTETPVNMDFNENVNLLGINWQVSLGGGAIVRQAQLRVEIYQTQQVQALRATPYKTGAAIAGGSAVVKPYLFGTPVPVLKGERIRLVDIMADALLAGEEFGSAKEVIYE